MTDSQIKKGTKGYASPFVKITEVHCSRIICLSNDDKTLGIEGYDRETIELE